MSKINNSAIMKVSAENPPLLIHVTVIWDKENLPKIDSDPIELIKALMQQNGLKSKDVSKILGVNKSTASIILNYQKGLSKNSIRILAKYFSISQESLNKPYRLRHKLNRKFKNASLMNTKKELQTV